MKIDSDRLRELIEADEARALSMTYYKDVEMIVKTIFNIVRLEIKKVEHEEENKAII